nr:hypothetical protein Iba_chr09fCG1960 [Ipomoea batatas]
MIEILRTSPRKPKTRQPMSVVAGPTMNLKTIDNAVTLAPHSTMFSCSAIHIPMLNMATPLPAFDMITIDPSIILGSCKFHLLAKRAQKRPRKHA